MQHTFKASLSMFISHFFLSANLCPHYMSYLCYKDREKYICIVCKLGANTVLSQVQVFYIFLVVYLGGVRLRVTVLNKTFGCNLYPRLRCVHRYGVTGYRCGNVSVTRGVTRATPYPDRVLAEGDPLYTSW